MTIKTYANDGQLTFPEMDNNWTELEAGVNGRQRKHGFEVGADGARLATIAYNPATRVLTITPTATSFTFYIDGVKFTKTGVQTATAHDAASGRYFYYYDDEGNIQISTTPWSIVDRTVTPAAFVFYNHSIAKGIPMVELHGADRWLEGHKNLHFTQGTRKLSGFGLSGFSLNTDTDDAVKFGVATGQIADEDLVTVVDALADGGPYTVFYRTGANGDWTWDSTPVYPFLAGATYPQYNQNTGVTWQMTELSGVGSGTWCNYFLFAVPSVDAATQLLLVPGQTQHASLTAAQAEGVSGIAWGTMPFEEIAPLYKITLHARSTYTNTYNVEIVGVTEILAGGASVITSVSPSVHNSLSSRDAADAHPSTAISFSDPIYVATNVGDAITETYGFIDAHTSAVADAHSASAITNTPAGDVEAVTVQAAIDELDTDKLAVSTFSGHIDALAVDAHPATAISFYNLDMVATEVSSAVTEVHERLAEVEEHFSSDARLELAAPSIENADRSYLAIGVSEDLSGPVATYINSYAAGDGSALPLYVSAGIGTSVRFNTDQSAEFYGVVKIRPDGTNEKLRADEDGTVAFGAAAGPGVSPGNTHVVGPDNTLFGAHGALHLGSNTMYYNGAWRYTITGAIALYQATGGAHKFWSANSGTAGADASAALTEKFRVDNGKTYGFQQFIQGSVAQITGTNTPPDGGGLELHYIPGGAEAYVQALDRSGTTWQRLRLQGSDVQLNPSNTNKGGADANGLYGVAMSKSSAPSTTEIPSGYWRVVKNTNDGTVKLYYNDGGVLKSVALA